MTMDALSDVMRYYHFAVIPLYCLALAAVFAAVAAFQHKTLRVYAVVISLLALAGNLSQFFFLGVLADNQADISAWRLQAVFLTVVCLFTLLFSVICFFAKKKQRPSE